MNEAEATRCHPEEKCMIAMMIIPLCVTLGTSLEDRKCMSIMTDSLFPMTEKNNTDISDALAVDHRLHILDMVESLSHHCAFKKNSRHRIITDHKLTQETKNTNLTKKCQDSINSGLPQLRNWKLY